MPNDILSQFVKVNTMFKDELLTATYTTSELDPIETLEWKVERAVRLDDMLSESKDGLSGISSLVDRKACFFFKIKIMNFKDGKLRLEFLDLNGYKTDTSDKGYDFYVEHNSLRTLFERLSNYCYIVGTCARDMENLLKQAYIRMRMHALQYAVPECDAKPDSEPTIAWAKKKPLYIGEKVGVEFDFREDVGQWFGCMDCYFAPSAFISKKKYKLGKVIEISDDQVVIQIHEGSKFYANWETVKKMLIDEQIIKND